LSGPPDVQQLPGPPQIPHLATGGRRFGRIAVNAYRELRPAPVPHGARDADELIGSTPLAAKRGHRHYRASPGVARRLKMPIAPWGVFIGSPEEKTRAQSLAEIRSVEKPRAAS